MKVLITQSFTQRDASTGKLWSPRKGAIVDMDSDVANALISVGYAEAYTLVTPTGTKSITANGEANVAGYAKANVAVPEPTGSISITENGEAINVAAYATANVAVPNPSTGTLEITAEGTYDVTNYASVHVEIAATEGEGGAE